MEYFTWIGNVDYGFSYDAPGLMGKNVVNAEEVKAWWSTNFKEFIRIDIDNGRPTGEIVDGSRASSFVDWHVRHTWTEDENLSCLANFRQSSCLNRTK
jgi:hypothetical protein